MIFDKFLTVLSGHLGVANVISCGYTPIQFGVGVGPGSDKKDRWGSDGV